MKDVFEYLFGRLKDKFTPVETVDGQAYAVKHDGTIGSPIRRLEPQWRKPKLAVSTLQALADIYKAGIDDLDANDVAVHIVNYRTVQIVSIKADEYGYRHVWAEAKHTSETPFVFGNFYEPEDFLIAFRASFDFTEEAVKVQTLCSTVSSEDSVSVKDNGISQVVEVKSGTVTRGNVELPPEGVNLVPWRTFRDANAVMSKFLLRMKGEKDELPKIALIEIDAKWQLDTIGSIRKWLETNIPDVQVIA